MTEVLKLTGGQGDEALLQKAARILQSGGLVAFPTETVYGLGASAINKAAVEKIYLAKQRPAWDPVIAHFDSFRLLSKYLRREHPLLKNLIGKFMPGPLTILLDQGDMSRELVTASGGKISLRLPAFSTAQKFIHACGVPVAAPSANLFGRPSPTTAMHVLEDLDGKIDAVIDAGATPIGVESTVLDLTTSPPAILRPGGVTKEQLEAEIGPLQIVSRVFKASDSHAAPGQSLSHYAPNAKVVLAEGTQAALLEAAANFKGQHIGVLLPRNWQAPVGAEVFDWGNFENKEELAARLFLGFRELDKRGVEVIVCPKPAEDGLGLALGDRLQRASAG